MNDTEQRIKEALGLLAERTPHPGPTLNALRRKRKRQRNNIFLIATAGMAAVVVLIFAGVVASDRYTPPNPNDAAAVLMPVNGEHVALKYAPHWLPDSYVERFRITSDPVSREWAPAGHEGQGGAPAIILGASQGMPDTNGRDETTVRGLKAWVQVSGQTANVVWKAQDVLSVTVRGLDDVRAVALRVAESVRADAKITHQAVFKLEGKYPDQMGGTAPGEWDASLNRGSVSVHVSPQKPQLLTANEPVTARGKEGVRSGETVAVQDGGLWISATSTEYSDLLVELVNKVEFVDSPDTNWVGKGL